MPSLKCPCRVKIRQKSPKSMIFQGKRRVKSKMRGSEIQIFGFAAKWAAAATSELRTVSAGPWQLAANGLVGSIPERVIGLHDLVNLARPFVDHGAFRVAVKPSDRIFVRIPVGTVDLHRVGRSAFGRHRREPF